MDETTRVCTKCGLELPITSFTVTDRRRGYRKARCKSCEAARVRAYYATHEHYRKAVKARALARDRANPERVRTRSWRHVLRKKYGMTPADYAAMFEAQGRCCALCGATDHGRTGTGGRHDGSRKWRAERWNVDHDHATGRVRGLLCQKCNVRVGAYEWLLTEIGIAKLRAYLAVPADE